MNEMFGLVLSPLSLVISRSFSWSPLVYLITGTSTVWLCCILLWVLLRVSRSFCPADVNEMFGLVLSPPSLVISCSFSWSPLAYIVSMILLEAFRNDANDFGLESENESLSSLDLLLCLLVAALVALDGFLVGCISLVFTLVETTDLRFFTFGFRSVFTALVSLSV